MDKSKSYAEITTRNQYKNVVNEWPDLKEKQKNKIKREGIGKCADGSRSDELITLTSAMERLNTDEIERNDEAIEAAKTLKSRDEIRIERQLRRKSKKIEKNEQRLQDKLAHIREPKSQKVQVVDEIVMETYLKSRKLSPTRNRRQNKSKNRSAIKIDLLDLINTKVVRPIDKSTMQSRQTIKLPTGTQRHKGKKSEVLKKKYVSKVKRSILQSRQLRQLRNEIETEVKNVSAGDKSISHDKEQECSHRAPLETKSNDELIVTTPCVKFSRKFRP